MRRALLAAVLVLGACTPPAAERSPSAPPSSSGASPLTVRAAGTLVRSDVARASGDLESARRAAAALAALDADLFAQLAKGDGNLVFSPYSVATALAMTRDGAVGKTRAEMDAVLHASDAGDLDAAFNALDRALAKRPGSYPFGNITVPLELGTANQLFVQRDLELAKAYLDQLAAYYGTGVGVVDYIAAREDARKTINAWVSDRTKTRIPELVPQGVLDDLTRLVLVNAIYLKARWEVPFEKSFTKAAPFHRLDGSDAQAELMRLGTMPNLPYARGTRFQAVSLPYLGGLSMVLVVPDAGSFAAVQSSLGDASTLRGMLDLPSRKIVRLSMPKFQLRSSAMLKGTLSKLGMPLAFTENADFSAMAPREKLLLQEVAHQAFVAVDEDGTEAAAATAVIAGATSAPSNVVELTIDRPFVFAIRDDETGAILFMGRVVDPTAK
ncbi:MAG TPA: serpin family protein [Candidatus Limnocylindria bacterium]|nr:serpin family protein [Candidatus Limnocylindria bacterium]